MTDRVNGKADQPMDRTHGRRNKGRAYSANNKPQKSMLWGFLKKNSLSLFHDKNTSKLLKYNVLDRVKDDY